MMVGLLLEELLEEFELAVEVLFLDWLLTKGMLLIILIWGLLLLLLLLVEDKDLLVAGTALTALTAFTAWLDLWLLDEVATVADLTADSVGWWLVLVASERPFEETE